MAKQIAKLLKSTIQDTSDLKQIAKTLAGKGRGGDSMLAHITPKEANILKAAGGAGTINPETGLLEFYDDDFAGGVTAAPYLGNWGSPPEYGTVGNPSVEQAPAYDWSSINVNRPEGGFGTSPALYPRVEQAPEYNWSGLNVADRGFGTAPYDATAAAAGYRGYTPLTPPNLATISGLREFQRPGIDFPSPQPTAAGVQTPPAAQEAGYFEKLKERLTRPEVLERFGLAGIGAIPGILQARQAAKEGRQAKQELQQLAAPYQTEGKRLLEQAQRGELTAPAQQQIQALQARAAQGVATRGGVGAEQAAAQVEAFRQQLLANQYDLGLKVSGIGDQIATGAIKAGLEANQYVNELTMAYYNNMFRGLGATGQQQTQPGR